MKWLLYSTNFIKEISCNELKCHSHFTVQYIDICIYRNICTVHSAHIHLVNSCLSCVASFKCEAWKYVDALFILSITWCTMHVVMHRHSTLGGQRGCSPFVIFGVHPQIEQSVTLIMHTEYQRSSLWQIYEANKDYESIHQSMLWSEEFNTAGMHGKLHNPAFSTSHEIFLNTIGCGTKCPMQTFMQYSCCKAYISKENRYDDAMIN